MMGGGLLGAAEVATALRATHPELERVRELAEGEPVFLVGGAVRDLLRGCPRADVDLVVLGDAATLAERLGGAHVHHERFSTAKAEVDGHEIDIASARTEAYPEPGSLPVVSAAGSIEEDLSRRDFTINAMALPLESDPELIDPYGGYEDLVAGRLRVLHPGSFTDDPTRALRAARYASRLGLNPDPETEQLLRETDLGTVSEDRRRAELGRLAAEPNAVDGLRLLAGWGLTAVGEESLELAAAVDRLLAQPLWSQEVTREDAILAAAFDGGRGEDLAAARPSRPSDGFALARGRDSVDLILARARGAEWVENHLNEWRRVALEIDGSDLITAGIAAGPAVGRGLEAALRGRLDGEIAGRDEELRRALTAAEEA